MTSSDLIPKSEDVRLACAFIPGTDKRGDVLALFALLETLREVPERVTEPMLGEIRLRWWYEAFEAIRDGRTPHHHPLTARLHAVIERHALPVQPLLDLIEGQMPLLDKGPLPLKTALEVVDRGEGIVAILGAHVLGGDADLTALMRLYGLAALKARRGIIEAGDTELAHLLRDARDAARRIPAHLMPLALPAALAQDLWHNRPPAPLRKRLRLTWSYMTGRI